MANAERAPSRPGTASSSARGAPPIDVLTQEVEEMEMAEKRVEERTYELAAASHQQVRISTSMYICISLSLSIFTSPTSSPLRCVARAPRERR